MRHASLRRRLTAASLVRENGYDNRTAYCDDLYAAHEHIQALRDGDFHVHGADGERRAPRDKLSRARCADLTKLYAVPSSGADGTWR
jgi:hypothetical protein